MADESAVDDEVLHDLWRNRIDPGRVAIVLAILARLTVHRPNFTDDDRADAIDLANDIDWPLGHLPIIAEVLAS